MWPFNLNFCKFVLGINNFEKVDLFLDSILFNVSMIAKKKNDIVKF